MYKLSLHKSAQCGFDGYSSEGHARTFFSYETPIYSICKERWGDVTDFTIKCINPPTHSVTTAKHATWSLDDELLLFECARCMRELLQNSEPGDIFHVLRDIHAGVWCIYKGSELVKTFVI